MAAVNYLWNPINDNIVREFDDAGNTIAEYTTEPDPYGNVVSQFRNGQTSYLLSDGQGNTTELTNDAGTVTDTIRYSAFGEVTERSGATEIPFQYVGQKGYYRDNDTRNYSIRQRSLSSRNGRWLTADPLGLALGNENLYIYGANSPLVLIDPSGLACTCTATYVVFPTSSPKIFAAAGYVKVSIEAPGTSPGSVSATLATHLACVRETWVEIGFICCRDESESFKHFGTYIHRNFEDIPLKATGGEDIVLTSLSIKLPWIKIGPKLTYYEILAADQKRADGLCVSKTKTFTPLTAKRVVDALESKEIACPDSANGTPPPGKALP